jgi:hypothetical protein
VCFESPESAAIVTSKAKGELKLGGNDLEVHYYQPKEKRKAMLQNQFQNFEQTKESAEIQQFSAMFQKFFTPLMQNMTQ